MNNKKNLPKQGILYGLTTTEFEQLLIDVLAQTGYSNLQITDGPNDKGIDIIGVAGGNIVAIQVKHKTKITLSEIDNFIKHYFSDTSTPRNLLFITSAELPDEISEISENVPPGCHLQFLGRRDIEQMFADYATITNRLLGLAETRLRSQRYNITFGILTVVITFAIGIIANLSTSFFYSSQAPLNKKIETVEKAITSMKDLESYLEEIKQDLADKEKATDAINRKYEQAKELEKLTDAQFSALQESLQKQNWYFTLINWITGFILGVASSFLASVLYAKWKRQKAFE